MATNVAFSTDNQPTDPITQTVYVKAAWADAWVEQAHLFCTSCKWSAAPEIPTATLVWRYGVGHRGSATDAVFTNVTRKSIGRYYVKIVFTQADKGGTNNEWYGGIDLEGDQRGGTATGGISQGVQQFICYGMEILLENHTIKRSWWTDDNFALHTAGHGFTFNKDGKKNMDDTTRTFDGTKDTGENLTEYWSSRAIVDYLLTYAAPTPEDLEPIGSDPFTEAEERQDPKVPFKLGDTGFYGGAASVVPDFDRPVIEQDGRRTLEVLNSVLARQRLLSYEMRVNTGNEVEVMPFSFLANDTNLVQSGNIQKANLNQRTISFSADASAMLTVSRSTTDSIDLVIARGAKRRNCGTFSYDDGTITSGWSTAHQTDYNNGASTASSPAYPSAANIDERQRRNAEARSVDKLRDVYSRFVIPDGWDQKVNDGQNGATDKPIAPVYLESAPNDRDVVYRLYGPNIKILPTLPLLIHHDYSGTNIDDDAVTSSGDGPYPEMQPLVITPLLEVATRFVQVENVGINRDRDYAGTGDDRSWSGMVTVEPDSRAIRVTVQGAPQHKIAADEFTPVDSSDWAVDWWNWRDFIFTLAIEDDRYCESQYPTEFPAGVDAARTLIINMGDGFKLDYVAENTVVGIDGAEGDLIRSTSGGFVRDDREALKDVAQIAWEWYQSERIALEWSTATFVGFDELRVGDLITTIETGSDQLTCDCCVTSITIESPREVGSTSPSVPRVTYQTQYADLDPVRFFSQ